MYTHFEFLGICIYLEFLIAVINFSPPIFQIWHPLLLIVEHVVCIFEHNIKFKYL